MFLNDTYTFMTILSKIIQQLSCEILLNSYASYFAFGILQLTKTFFINVLIFSPKY